MDSHEKLDKLLETFKGERSILVCAHTNPDPDALAAAAGIRFILNKLLKVRCRVVFGGMVGRAENQAMINQLRLSVDRFDKRMVRADRPVILVDTQPGTSNNPLPKWLVPTAVIDHHRPIRRQTAKCRFMDVRPDYGATSTIVTEYMREAGLDPPARTATALLYGIQTDTLGLGRTGLKKDMEAMQYLFTEASIPLLYRIQTPKLPRAYLFTFADAIEKAEVVKDVLVCHLEDVTTPDVVAEMADFLLKAEGITWVMVTGFHVDTLLFSLRTSGRSRAAGDIARRIAARRGAGGGHGTSAGGALHIEGPKDYQKSAELLEERLLAVLKRAGEPHRFRPEPEQGHSETASSEADRDDTS